MKQFILISYSLLSFAAFAQVRQEPDLSELRQGFLQVDLRTGIRLEELNLPTPAFSTEALRYHHTYTVWLLYKDGRPPEVYQFSFRAANCSWRDVVDPYKALRVLKNGELHAVDKKLLSHIILDQMILVANDGDFSMYDEDWGLLEVNGPVQVIRWFHQHKVTGALTVRKEYRAASKTVLQYSTGWRKEMARLLSANQTLSEKVLQKVRGYRRPETTAILMEYNAWLLQQDPEAFAAAALPLQLQVP